MDARLILGPALELQPHLFTSSIYLLISFLINRQFFGIRKHQKIVTTDRLLLKAQHDFIKCFFLNPKMWSSLF